MEVLFMVLLPTPTKSSTAEFTYTFAGWYTTASGGTQVTANTTMGAGNTIYALLDCN